MKYPAPETVWQLLTDRAAHNPDGLLAVDEHGHNLTFGDTHERALGLAALLERRGIGPGSVVAWQFPNRLDAIVLMFALARLDTVQVPLIAILREREVGFICKQAATQLLVVPPDFAVLAEAVAADLPGLEVMVLDSVATGGEGPRVAVPTVPSADRWYFYTSGTTADPKGAKHTDASLVAATRGFVDALSITSDDRVAFILPLTHVGGIIHVISTLLTGAPMLTSSVFDPNRTPAFLREQRATSVPGSTPFVHAYFAFADANPELEPLFPSARMMTHGGSPKPPELHYRVRERFGTAGIVSGYGMTECPMAIWSRPGDGDESIATTEGRPVIGIELRLVDADGGEVAPGSVGEIRLRGPQLMSGYVDPSLDYAAFDELGYFCSGDLGRLDAAGNLHVTGRLKDIIIRNMENISALEVENLLSTHPSVADVAVIGMPDPRTGEQVCAVVVARGSAPTLESLCDHLVAAGLSRRKLPERLELVDALPRNAMQKVRKVDLRARFGG